MPVPKKIKTALEKNRLYLRLRYSQWIHALWLLLRTDVKKELAEKEAFYDSVLPHNCRVIFDIGANEGALSEIFSKHAPLVVAVEPSQRNVSILSARFHNRKHITIVAKAAGNAPGYQPWYEDSNDYAMGTLSRKWNNSKQNRTVKSTEIETVTLDDLIDEFGVPDYIKIDVEGYEWQVLQGLSQPVSLLSFEAILPQFLEETIACIQRLLLLNPDAHFNYNIENRFAYNAYQASHILLEDVTHIRQTIDIFCKL